jgi:RNA polymerase sigma-70 factor (ECF subfamily)
MDQIVPTNEELYREYAGKVRRYVAGKIPNPQEAEDLVSAVFVKVCEKRLTYNPEKASPSTWIYTITKNTVTDYYRQAKPLYPLPEELPSAETIDAALLSDEALNSLADALEKLDARSQDIIILHYYKGMTLKAVALALGMSYANTKLVHRKALGQLNKMLETA